MTSLYIIRHAQAEGNLMRRFQGHIDLPLTPLGHEQIALLANRFLDVPLAAVYSSPLARAWRTAEGLAAPHRLTPVACPAVIEINGGDMENQPFALLAERYPVEYRQFTEEPHNFRGIGGGESMEDVYTRVRDGVLELVRRHAGESVAVVSHGAAIRCFLCFAAGLPLSRMAELGWGANTNVSRVEFDGALRPELLYRFDDSHLTPLAGQEAL